MMSELSMKQVLVAVDAYLEEDGNKSPLKAPITAAVKAAISNNSVDVDIEQLKKNITTDVIFHNEIEETPWEYEQIVSYTIDRLHKNNMLKDNNPSQLALCPACTRKNKGLINNA